MNQYVVYFEAQNGTEVGLVISIDVSINRPNNPSDDELIFDYLYQNYGNTMSSETIKYTLINRNDFIKIDEDYCIET